MIPAVFVQHCSKPSLSSPSSTPIYRWRPASIWRLLGILAAFGLVAWIGQIASLLESDMRIYETEHVGESQGDEQGIGNSTLGFQDIIAIVPPDTPKFAGPLVNAGKATGLQFTFVEAVSDRDILFQNGVQAIMDEYGFSPGFGEQGQIISHRRAWERMLDSDLKTALIIEGDADWDMRIHSSLNALASNVVKLAPQETKKKRIHARNFFSSAGVQSKSWDILYLGHCGAIPESSAQTLLYDDPTSSSARHEHPSHFSPPAKTFPRGKGERLLFVPSKLACITAYAITRSAARKLLSMTEIADKIWDRRPHQHLALSILSLCKSSDRTCFAPFPSLFTPIDTPNDESTPTAAPDTPPLRPEPGPGIQYSARVNGKSTEAPFTEDGGEERWIDEWSDVEQMQGFRAEKGEMDQYHSMNAGNCEVGSKGCFDWQNPPPPSIEQPPPPMPLPGLPGEARQAEDDERTAGSEESLEQILKEEEEKEQIEKARAAVKEDVKR